MEGGKEECESAHKMMEMEEEEEEEGDLFEINLEIVNKIPPPQYYWETIITTNTLLANCLLPIADVSCAVPIVVTAASLPRPAITQDQPTSNFHYNKMKA